MKSKWRYLLWGLVATGCVLFQLANGQTGWFFGYVVALPFRWIGCGLRMLSLSGAAGNIAAIGLYLLLCLLPLLGLLPMQRIHHWEDWLLGLSVPVLGLVYWCNINPGRLCALSIEMEQFCLGAAIWMLLLSYALLRLLRSCFEGETRQAMRWLLEGLGLTFIAVLFGSCLSSFLEDRASFLASNTGGHKLTECFLVLQHLKSALPYVLDLWVLCGTWPLLETTDRYSETMVQGAAALAHRCRTALSINLLTIAGFNLLQLCFLPQLRDADLQLTLPLTSLIFVLLVLLLSRQYAEGKILKDDNDTII